MYAKRGGFIGGYHNEEDYVFEDAWTPEKSREEAIVSFYRASTEQDQKSYFNEKVE